ncbi:MAG: enoyl-CoA hydratase [Alphaproteobacteria bacterium]|nr:enoyl-CoA hydratase [Alphaproteobacteria bacterium]
MADDLIFEVKGRVGWATFNRPAQRNALTFGMYEGLAALCDRLAASREVGALVIRGAGEQAFAAGTDIAQFRDFRSGEDGIAYERKMDRILDTIERCPIPTIAAIAGACTGGGAAIAAVCDLRLAAPNARFGFPIARTLGNCLSMSNYTRLAALVGPQRTKEMIFLATLVDGPTARDIGLVGEVLTDPAALWSRAQRLGEEVAGHAPITLAVTKEALRRLQAGDAASGIDDLIRRTYGSADFREGMDAFLGKRAPVWKGA